LWPSGLASADGQPRAFTENVSGGRSDVTARFLYARGYWNQALALQQTALAAARQAGDREGEARALALLGCMHGFISDFAATRVTLRQALALYRDLGDRAGHGYVLNGMDYLLSVAGDYPAMSAAHQQPLALFVELDYPEARPTP
jgi:hypothetical protein